MNTLNRRSFLSHSAKMGLGLGLASLTNIPPVVQRALAEGQIGLNGKKLLFIFLRGGEDGLNSVIPAMDGRYAAIRPDLAIPLDPGADYSASGAPDVPMNTLPDDPTYGYDYAIRTGNGFCALHPSYKFLSPLLASGELRVQHRVGYPIQSRSHFDSQQYWENGSPNDKYSANFGRTGILYRTMLESGLTSTQPLTGVSFQNALPQILRGNKAAMTNLASPLRYDLLGIPNNSAANQKMDAALIEANKVLGVNRLSRDLLNLQYGNLMDTLELFASIDFSDAGNLFEDDIDTDNDFPYRLFPHNNDTNGGWRRPDNSTRFNKYVVPPSPFPYTYFRNLKAAALVLNNTDAIVSGTEFGGFDTHNNQIDANGSTTGNHAALLQRIGWSMYALSKFFKIYGKGGARELPGAKVSWNDVVVVTMTEFGRTSVQNDSRGTDHAEANVMMIAGGGINGGVGGCSPSDPIPWTTDGSTSMLKVRNRYLERATDYRSILGELIRDHLGASTDQLKRIIPGYGVTSERLLSGGISGLDGTQITGEVGLLS